MKPFTLLSLLCLLTCFGCSSSEETDNELPEKQSFIPDHIKAQIDGKNYIIYRDPKLNKSAKTNFQQFSFGVAVTSDSDTKQPLDTSIVLSGSKSTGYSIDLRFPYTEKPETFSLFHASPFKENLTAGKTAYHEGIVYDWLAKKNYSTYDWFRKDNAKAKKIGEVRIDVLDMKQKLIKGQFYFTACMWYTNDDDKLVQTDDSLKVTNGEFYYHWDDKTFPIKK
ncbi:MAG: hypothetical protein MI784_00935 [Cytophagales bacterium]|nr:hypothetical protein [Cytophagales bacterium]